MESDGKSDYGLRVGVQGGGCSGLSYFLGFDKEAGADERTFESNGLKIFVDLKSYLYVKGLTLDYTTGLDGRGFVFMNPNAAKTCGCGSSFTA